MSNYSTFLSGIKGFDKIDEAGLVAISERIEAETFEAGRRIIRRGEAGDKMYVVREGTVQVPVLDAKGGTRMVARLGPGEIFGEMALLTGEPRVADVLAETRVETLSIDRKQLDPLLRETPVLARLLTELLGQRLEEGDGIRSVGKYRLLELIGVGSTARVFGAVHPGLDRVVAIKMLSHTLAFDQMFRERFLQEARTIASLSHPNIVQIYDMEEAYATFFIVMERVSGDNVEALLDRQGPMDPDKAMSILSQVADALHFAHRRGIIHRDVKPGNCAIDAYGRAKLMDFGIAQRVRKRKTGERATVVEGSPRYMAPEAALGEEIDGRADIYSLAVTAYEMVVGEPLFKEPTVNRMLAAHVRKRAPDIRKVRDDIPDGLAEFIRAGLIKQPDQRLSDWPRILELLNPGRPPAEIVHEALAERIIRVRYPRDLAQLVNEATDTLNSRLSRLDGVDVASADLILRGTRAPDGRDATSESTRTTREGGYKFPFFKK